jgi:prevent-host-death family protein
MSVSLTEDVKTVSEVKQNLRAVLGQIRDTGRPVVVTVNGKPDAVLIDVETYERKLKVLNLVGLLAEGEQDVQQGRTRPASAFLKEFRRAKKIPR